MANNRPLIGQFNDYSKIKTPYLAKRNVTFHQGNARVHTCVVVVAKFNLLGYKSLHNPSYSPDLGPSAKKIFGPNAEFLRQTNTFFVDLYKLYYLEEVKMMKKRCTQYKEFKEDYIEKFKKLSLESLCLIQKVTGSFTYIIIIDAKNS